MQPSDKGCYSAKSCLRTINLLIESQCNWQYDLHTVVQRIRWTNWCYPRRGSRSASSLFDKASTSYGFRAMFVSLSMSSIFSMMNALSRDNIWFMDCCIPVVYFMVYVLVWNDCSPPNLPKKRIIQLCRLESKHVQQLQQCGACSCCYSSLALSSPVGFHTVGLASMKASKMLYHSSSNSSNSNLS
jgi:hypothetical protein